MTQPAHSHSVSTGPDGTTTTTNTMVPAIDPTTGAPLATTSAPSPTTVVVTTPAATPVQQTVSMGAVLMIATGAAIAGAALMYFWPDIVGEAKKAVLSAEATENPIRRRKRRKK